MNDRFKFRTGFTISFYDIAGNDVERQIILDSCFSIDNGGEGICVNEKIIQEALDIYVAKDEHKSAWDFINANYAETDGYYFIDSVDFLDQCTGLKDKNGKLIYEGDIILVENNKCSVEWESENARYNVIGYGEIAYLNYNDIEVVGNIHENADLIKVGGK
ncbi:MAG: hypothetical protein IJS26_05650 [Alphaproteobacteria bacterium]|nr:hypothetical protein [Alphaproteobacteria bacterium]